MKLTCLALFAAPVFVLTGDSTALANTYVHGSICQPNGLGGVLDIAYTNFGFENRGPNPVNAYCPIPVDHGIGAVIQFDVLVDDYHTTYPVSCAGYAYDAAGKLLGVAPHAMSSGTGSKQLLTMSFNYATNANIIYVVVCNVPEANGQAFSKVHYVRAY